MKKILIYAGTTEGRLLAQKLAERGVSSVVCVATEYGQQVMQETEEPEEITVRQGRLLPDQMQAMLREEEFLAVVDATHPFATVVTENILQSVQGSDIPYFRLAREYEEGMKNPDGVFYDSAESCAKALEACTGMILLTTGSKELELFCKNEELKKRLIVRVLPGRESMELCWKNGLEGKQIIAMQGPFSKEMNLATIRQYGITDLVTKDSGKNGGINEKTEAAKEAGITCHVIRKPKVDGAKEISFEEVFHSILELAHADVREGQASEKAKLNIVLAGIGPGTKDYWTIALEKRIAETDFLFGAKRMLDGLKAKKESYPYYLAKDILPCLQRIREEYVTEQRITILFSGDTGFYSGAEKLLPALRGLEGAEVSVLPGISTLSALSAKFGICWQNVMILSTHGTEKDSWKTEMLFGCRRGRSMFFLTSGAKDVQEIGRLMQEYGLEERFSLRLGKQLSYGDEKWMELTAREAAELTEEGLYAGFLMPRNPEDPTCQISPGWRDEVFLRDKVPMTKEEVRGISICKLRLTENAIAYDVGSGTGSIAMEMAALSPKISVYAIEYKPEAISLIQKNKEKFGAFNVTVVEAMAPEGLEQLPAPTHVFIGGSKGNLREILDAVYRKNPHARVVMNAISLESLAQMQTLIKEYPIKELDVTSVSVSKAKRVGDYHLMEAGNPVTIFSFQFQETVFA